MDSFLLLKRLLLHDDYKYIIQFLIHNHHDQLLFIKIIP